MKLMLILVVSVTLCSPAQAAFCNDMQWLAGRLIGGASLNSTAGALYDKQVDEAVANGNVHHEEEMRDAMAGAFKAASNDVRTLAGLLQICPDLVRGEMERRE